MRGARRGLVEGGKRSRTVCAIIGLTVRLCLGRKSLRSTEVVQMGLG